MSVTAPPSHVSVSSTAPPLLVAACEAADLDSTDATPLGRVGHLAYHDDNSEEHGVRLTSSASLGGSSTAWADDEERRENATNAFTCPTVYDGIRLHPKPTSLSSSRASSSSGGGGHLKNGGSCPTRAAALTNTHASSGVVTSVVPTNVEALLEDADTAALCFPLDFAATPRCRQATAPPSANLSRSATQPSDDAHAQLRARDGSLEESRDSDHQRHSQYYPTYHRGSHHHRVDHNSSSSSSLMQPRQRSTTARGSSSDDDGNGTATPAHRTASSSSFSSSATASMTECSRVSRRREDGSELNEGRNNSGGSGGDAVMFRAATTTSEALKNVTAGTLTSNGCSAGPSVTTRISGTGAPASQQPSHAPSQLSSLSSSSTPSKQQQQQQQQRVNQHHLPHREKPRAVLRLVPPLDSVVESEEAITPLNGATTTTTTNTTTTTPVISLVLSPAVHPKPHTAVAGFASKLPMFESMPDSNKINQSSSSSSNNSDSDQRRKSAGVEKKAGAVGRSADSLTPLAGASSTLVWSKNSPCARTPAHRPAPLQVRALSASDNVPLVSNSSVVSTASGSVDRHESLGPRPRRCSIASSQPPPQLLQLQPPPQQQLRWRGESSSLNDFATSPSTRPSVVSTPTAAVSSFTLSPTAHTNSSFAANTTPLLNRSVGGSSSRNGATAQQQRRTTPNQAAYAAVLSMARPAPLHHDRTQRRKTHQRRRSSISSGGSSRSDSCGSHGSSSRSSRSSSSRSSSFRRRTSQKSATATPHLAALLPTLPDRTPSGATVAMPSPIVWQRSPTENSQDFATATAIAGQEATAVLSSARDEPRRNCTNFRARLRNTWTAVLVRFVLTLTLPHVLLWHLLPRVLPMAAVSAEAEAAAVPAVSLYFITRDHPEVGLLLLECVVLLVCGWGVVRQLRTRSVKTPAGVTSSRGPLLPAATTTVVHESLYSDKWLLQPLLSPEPSAAPAAAAAETSAPPHTTHVPAMSAPVTPTDRSQSHDDTFVRLMRARSSAQARRQPPQPHHLGYHQPHQQHYTSYATPHLQPALPSHSQPSSPTVMNSLADTCAFPAAATAAAIMSVDRNDHSFATIHGPRANTEGSTPSILSGTFQRNDNVVSRNGFDGSPLMGQPSGTQSTTISFTTSAGAATTACGENVGVPDGGEAPQKAVATTLVGDLLNRVSAATHVGSALVIEQSLSSLWGSGGSAARHSPSRDSASNTCDPCDHRHYDSVAFPRREASAFGLEARGESEVEESGGSCLVKQRSATALQRAGSDTLTPHCSNSQWSEDQQPPSQRQPLQAAQSSPSPASVKPSFVPMALSLGFLVCTALAAWRLSVDFYFAWYNFQFDTNGVFWFWLVPSSLIATVAFLYLFVAGHVYRYQLASAVRAAQRRRPHQGTDSRSHGDRTESKKARRHRAYDRVAAASLQGLRWMPWCGCCVAHPRPEVAASWLAPQPQHTLSATRLARPSNAVPATSIVTTPTATGTQPVKSCGARAVSFTATGAGRGQDGRNSTSRSMGDAFTTAASPRVLVDENSFSGAGAGDEDSSSRSFSHNPSRSEYDGEGACAGMRMRGSPRDAVLVVAHAHHHHQHHHHQHQHQHHPSNNRDDSFHTTADENVTTIRSHSSSQRVMDNNNSSVSSSTMNHEIHNAESLRGSGSEHEISTAAVPSVSTPDVRPRRSPQQLSTSSISITVGSAPGVGPAAAAAVPSSTPSLLLDASLFTAPSTSTASAVATAARQDSPSCFFVTANGKVSSPLYRRTTGAASNSAVLPASGVLGSHPPLATAPLDPSGSYSCSVLTQNTSSSSTANANANVNVNASVDVSPATPLDGSPHGRRHVESPRATRLACPPSSFLTRFAYYRDKLHLPDLCMRLRRLCGHHSRLLRGHGFWGSHLSQRSTHHHSAATTRGSHAHTTQSHHPHASNRCPLTVPERSGAADSAWMARRGRCLSAAYLTLLLSFLNVLLALMYFTWQWRCIVARAMSASMFTVDLAHAATRAGGVTALPPADAYTCSATQQAVRTLVWVLPPVCVRGDATGAVAVQATWTLANQVALLLTLLNKPRFVVAYLYVNVALPFGCACVMYHLVRELRLYAQSRRLLVLLAMARARVEAMRKSREMMV